MQRCDSILSALSRKGCSFSGQYPFSVSYVVKHQVVMGVTTDKVAGTYGVGEVISFFVAFSDEVHLTTLESLCCRFIVVL